MASLDPLDAAATQSPYEALFRAARFIPISHYLLGLSLILIVFLYNFFEIHFLEDLFTGFRGQPVVLTFSSSSRVYRHVVSKCKILHGRYLSTPWLSSPHLQTMFVQFFGNSPPVDYGRQIFTASDGGSIALDWVRNDKVKNSAFQMNGVLPQDDKNPIVIIVPGLTSDSNSSYVKHLAFVMAKRGWNVVVANHRGLAGLSITSDCFYNAGWTEDARKVIDHIHCQHSEAPLFVVGTSIGANILVKYLAEDGLNTPIVGAAAICSPWDLLICDRFISRRLVQRFYNKALTIGLKDYAHLHEAALSRLSNWEGIKKSRSVRDFDDSATRILANYETVDTYYRHCSSSNFVGSVMVPLLCISSLDDPVCTSEAIPWDECRLNPNVVLATTQHGGHLPYFEGLTATSVWWVRALAEYFDVLLSSPLRHRKKEVSQSPVGPVQSIDHAPYMHVLDDGTVAAVSDKTTEGVANIIPTGQEKQDTVSEVAQATEVAQSSPKQDISNIVAPLKRKLNQLARQNRTSLWLIAYIAFITTWPVLGSALLVMLRKRFKSPFSRAPVRR